MASVDDQLLGVTGAPPVPAAGGPSRELVKAAIGRSVTPEDRRSKVMKVLYLDDAGQSVGEWASSQIPENPWDGQTAGGLQEPPYRLEQMVFLAEMHPVHSAALEQKTADICGKGWDWEPLDDQNADDDVKEATDAWFKSLAADDEDMQELITAVWLDVETVGWGLFECTRDGSGKIQKVYHVPGHTVRAHRNGFALCQVRDQRKVWFRRWGSTDIQGKRVDVDQRTGSITNVKVPANDMFVVRRNSRRSTWYGIPGYISAMGWITLAMAARDDNLLFFANRREPRWAIILTDLTDDPDLEEDLRRAFTVDLKQPYRNLIVPITGPGKVTFQKLSDTAKDGSFEKLSERADKAIMVGHRVPAGRIANAQIGPLGGNNTVAENRIYKDGVVNPGQELLNNRLRKFINTEFEIVTGKNPVWELKMDDLDVSSEREELDAAGIAFKNDMITLREARARIGLGPIMEDAPLPEAAIDPETGLPAVDPETGQPPEQDFPLDENGDPILPEQVESKLNDMLYSQLPGTAGTGGAPGTLPGGSGGLTNPSPNSDVSAARTEGLFAILHGEVREALEGVTATHELLESALQAREEA